MQARDLIKRNYVMWEGKIVSIDVSVNRHRELVLEISIANKDYACIFTISHRRLLEVMNLFSVKRFQHLVGCKAMVAEKGARDLAIGNIKDIWMLAENYE